MLLRIFTFLSLFLGFVSCHHSPTPTSITHLAERQKGMGFFEKAYQKYGDNTDSLAMANYDSAVKYFTIYLRHNPVIDTTNQSIKLKLGYAYTQLERLNEADSCFSNLSPHQFEHNYWYGNYLYKKTDYQKAYTTFKSLENHPFIQQDSNWKAQLCMDIANSKCEFELFSYTDSIEVVSYFKKAYQIASKRYLQLKSIYNLGVFWGERGDFIREDSCLTFASNAYDKEGILPPESFYLNCSYDAPPNKAKVYLQKERER